ncbi:hypothetical protein ACIQUL_30030 [Streptomyces sp. NPDC090303]|uniref:hypothetical protein n=1 Tax=Streptomyces sp. NPDC090303 TaxID=3365960 RepID=UPI003808ABFF
MPTDRERECELLTHALTRFPEPRADNQLGHAMNSPAMVAEEFFDYLEYHAAWPSQEVAHLKGLCVADPRFYVPVSAWAACAYQLPVVFESSSEQETADTLAAQGETAFVAVFKDLARALYDLLRPFRAVRVLTDQPADPDVRALCAELGPRARLANEQVFLTDTGASLPLVHVPPLGLAFVGQTNPCLQEFLTLFPGTRYDVHELLVDNGLPALKDRAVLTCAFGDSLPRRRPAGSTPEPQASSSRRAEAVRRTPPRQKPEPAGQKPQRTILPAVRAGLTKANAAAFDGLDQESENGQNKELKFGVYHPDEGPPALRFEHNGVPPIRFAATYTGTVSIPSKGTRNPITALRRRANKEHVRGDVAVWSDHQDFDLNEVIALLNPAVTRKTVSLRGVHPAERKSQEKKKQNRAALQDFLTTGARTPEWARLKTYAVKALVSDSVNFLEAVQVQEDAMEIYREHIPSDANQPVNVDSAVSKALREAFAAGTLTTVDFFPARDVVVEMLMTNTQEVERMQRAIRGER